MPALDLEPERPDFDELVREYQKLGFKRQTLLFSLKKNNMLKAVAMVDISDIGLNLSDLTNSIKIFVIDPNGLSNETLNRMLSLLCEKINQENTSILLFPAAYAKHMQIPYERIYNLWVLKMQASDYYFKYVDRLLRLA